MIAPGGLRCFEFTHVFDPSASQTLVYDSCGRGSVADFLNGFNTTLIVFGQTGSGKTYTMFGPDDTRLRGSEGIVPRAIQEVVGLIPACIPLSISCRC